jgi:uncharacterized protein (DUF2236 family)
VTVTDRAEVDLGLFGPGSMAWRLHREPALLVGGLRALLVQALHPLAIAAVADHSNYRSDVWGRYARTSNYVTTTIFGTTRQARALGARVRQVHRPIRGIDRVTGKPYAADDPTLLLWVHTTLVDSFLAAYRRFVAPLAPADADRYVAEMVRQAELVGLRAEQVPSNERTNRSLIDRFRPELRLTKAAVEAAETVLHPPLPPWRRPLWAVLGQAAISIMPDDALTIYGMRRNRMVEEAVRPLVHFGTKVSRRFLTPPPVIVAAAHRARAAGFTFP